MKGKARPAKLLVICNLVYAALLLVLALTPKVPSAAAGISDSLAHGLAYGVQAVLIYWALRPLTSLAAAAALAWSGATGFGLLTEVLQSLQPTRSPQIADVIADALGAGLAVLILLAARSVTAVINCRHRSQGR